MNDEDPNREPELQGDDAAIVWFVKAVIAVGVGLLLAILFTR